jgi:hypothetical protein
MCRAVRIRRNRRRPHRCDFRVIVDFHHELLDQGTVAILDPFQSFQFAAFNVDFQQVHALKAVFTERPETDPHHPWTEEEAQQFECVNLPLTRGRAGRNDGAA